MSRTTSIAVLVVAASFCLQSQVFGTDERSSVKVLEFLRAQVGLDDDEIRKIEKGEVVATILDTADDEEVAVFGAVWVGESKNLYLEKYKDIEKFEGAVSLHIRKISTPPEPADFAEMTLPEEDLEDLRECEVGDCEIKLSKWSLEQLRSQIDWSSPNATADVTELLRRRAYEYTVEYQRGGNQALAVYQDKDDPTFVAKELEELLANTPFLPTYLPALHRYLLEYPNLELPGSEGFFYWAENDFGLKPIVRSNHVTLYRPPQQEDRAVIASKQLYCTHYFHTALELRFLIEDSRRPGGFYIMSLKRSRSDGLTGFTGRLIRGRVRKSARDGLEEVLTHTKKSMEALNPKQPTLELKD